MELYYTFSILIVLAAIFAYLNHRFLRLPSSIGIMLIALLVSVCIVLFGDRIAGNEISKFSSMITKLDFSDVLMGAMLNFLLFAGAIHININDLKSQKGAVMFFSTLGVVISTFIVGLLMFYILPVLNIHLPLIYCLIFGALISPTDPIAVLSILKTTGVSKALETKFAGESLFNDGVAVVLFAVLLNIALGTSTDVTIANVGWLFVKEAGGGLVLGIALGQLCSYLMRKIDDYKVSVLMSLAVVMGGYLVAHSFHCSGPLTMVAAGLIIGNKNNTKGAMSEETKDYLNKFWELIDEILNAILFLIIGFELLIIPSIPNYWILGFTSVVLVLIARFVSIYVPGRLFPKLNINKAATTLLVWGGLRGGVSIALALSLPVGEHKDLVLGITYFVVIFSILVQGLTLGNLAGRIKKMAIQDKLK
ncbi:cation:proton antiporter [Sphingobacterium spiritivorum]|uniref:cation:proton antiporter n=1 Tax=Sphingobacterium spiritivorum TaxID=258 RepID=UPI001918FEA3|nr:sodium:proton antiporter [Sphingobacterium spiritivorum]QQT26332.1 sodium:proton antiporter [Sphingobacterium spiritivorum]